MDRAPSKPLHVRLVRITKVYGGVALLDLDLHSQGRPIHAICRENRAGESSLMGELGGVVRPDMGASRSGGRTTGCADQPTRPAGHRRDSSGDPPGADDDGGGEPAAER